MTYTMLERAILIALDHSNDGCYHFTPLNHACVHLINMHLNPFRDDNNWAIVAEILGYSPGSGQVEMQVL